MLKHLDRVQICSADPGKTAAAWIDLLDAREIEHGHVAALAAERISLAVGTRVLDILSPTGSGPVQRHLDQFNGGPFAAGFSCDELDALRAHLKQQECEFTEAGAQIYIDGVQSGISGLRVCISEPQARERCGLMENLYEVTHLTSEVEDAASRFAGIFKLNSDNFVPISSDNYGYKGVLTLLEPGQLDRVEMIHPFDLKKTMGRFFSRFGPSLYMCYGESDRIPELRQRLQTHAPADWTGPADGAIDGLFVHPKVLGGVMLGVSRPSYAWTWSGSPDKVAPDSQDYP